jgi:ribose 5-phosphate isomerase A
MNADPLTELKRQAGKRAVDFVESGMALALGTGSTTAYAIDEIGRRLKSGELENVVAIPTSERTVAQAERLGIPLGSLVEHPVLDLAIDGADEVDPDLNLIKGLGGALLREKIVEIRAQRFAVVIDESKLVDRLGSRGPLPVEVTQFSWQAHANWLASLGCRAELRREADGQPFVTDNGNYIIHCTFYGGIADPIALDQTLNQQPGILGTGLFLGMASEVVVAGKDGVQVITRS